MIINSNYSNSMKIVAISDLHGHLPELQPCDVVTISGDILPLHIQDRYEDALCWLAGPFQDWALKLDCDKVIFIAGNHDFVFEYMNDNGEHTCHKVKSNEPSWQVGCTAFVIMGTLFKMDDYANRKIIYLQDTAYTYNGVKFYGVPWCPNLRNWAFYGDKQHLLNQFNKIPDDVDVLITHCPPKYGLQGTVLETNWNYMNDFGCVELQQVIDERFANKDMWILSGHIHSGKHEVEKMNNVKYRNCSIKNEDYEVAYQPFEFEID